MSKGNMLLGYARGKVGSLVFSRRKGEQITRPRNFHPANPRTNAQMSQRMKMYAPVKLYKQSKARFFKYAFKLKAAETIFNAFMRENIAIAPWVSRDLASAGAPIPFPARMSSGSLASVDVRYSDDMGDISSRYATVTAREFDMFLGYNMPKVGEALTVGEFTQQFMLNNPEVQVGDQVTLVLVGTKSLSVSNGNVVYDSDGGFIFRYAKVVLNPDSAITMASLGFDVEEATDTVDYVGLSLYEFDDDDMVGGCVIVTRTNGSSVDASNSTLVLNAAAQSCYELMRSENYKEIAALTYRVEPDAYLNPATTE